VKRLKLTIVKNAFSNVLRGGAMALVAIVLPHFLTKLLDHDRFAAWALMLQVAAYANYLDFGLQTAIARFLAQAVERGDEEARDRLVSTALFFLCIAAVIAGTLLATVCIFVPQIFPQIPASLIGELRLGIAILGGSAALLLPFSIFTGILVGLHRNELPAEAVGGSRILGAILVLVAVRHTHSLAVLAACIAIPNLVGAVVQALMSRRLLPNLAVTWAKVSRQTGHELTRYCGTLVVWSVSMMMVSGLDLVIVGHADFARVGAYAVAALLATFLAGVNSAICSALLAPIAVLQQRAEVHRIQEIVRLATRTTSFADFAVAFASIFCGYPILRLWVGPVYASQAASILIILMFANAVRLVGNPTASALMATGQQRYGLFGGLSEGISNLICSIVGVIFFGAIGVAWGTMCGAIVSVIWIFAFILPKLHCKVIVRQEFLFEGFLRPLLCLLPIGAYAVFVMAVPAQAYRVPILGLMIAASGVFTYFWGGFRQATPAVVGEQPS
jgi:O-antigen/teichoic acid export membrane protein